MDHLFLLKPGFSDPNFPEKKFYCWHCALIEGVLVSFPDLLENLRVERIPWTKPRSQLIAVTGKESHSLPLLILNDGRKSKYKTGEHLGRSLITDKDAILSYFSEVYEMPEMHP